MILKVTSKKNNTAHWTILRLRGLLIFTAAFFTLFSNPLFSQTNKCTDLLSISKTSRNEFARKILVPISHGALKLDQIDFNKPSIVIVDAYSSGSYFAPKAIDKGVQMIHVHSQGTARRESQKKSFREADFSLDLSFLENDISKQNNLNQLLEGIKLFKNLKAVVAGSDNGVLLADILAAEMHKINPQIPADVVSEKGIKKNKAEQNKRLRELGINSAEQFEANNVQDAIQWVRETGLLQKFPNKVVVKPTMSAGGDLVRIAHTEEEVASAVQEILKTPDEFGRKNNQALLQEFLYGDEYIFNTTSLHGRHIVTDIWVYQKKLQVTPDGKQTMIYDINLLLPFEGEIQKELTEYGLKVLKALGQENFNGHMEIMYVPGRGPYLVEHNARFMGAGLPLVVEKATNHSQLDLTLLAILEPEKFMKLDTGYKLIQHGANIIMTNSAPGRALNPDILKNLATMPGHSFSRLSKEFGRELAITKDLDSTFGDVTFLGNDEQALRDSINYYRQLEKNNSLTIPINSNH